MTMEESSLFFEQQAKENGYLRIAGVDEVGRGPLAGPVVAAAVVLPDDIAPQILGGVRDSKQLTEMARERYYEIITHSSAGCAVAQASEREIEETDIRQASLLAMRRAVDDLNPAPDYALIDGRDLPGLDIPGEAIIKGDSRSLTIGAASIVAKVTRDRMMVALDKQYPHYGFERHKGYPTKYHRIALSLFGICDLHRRTYAPVAKCLEKVETSAGFMALVEKIMQTPTVDGLNQLKDQFDKLILPPDEDYYLKTRLKYAVDSAKKELRRKKPSTVDRGADLETLAIDYMIRKGYALWERNFHCRQGEVDLIMNKDSLIVFVEVKSRSTKEFGMPYEAVNAKKRKKIILAADKYLLDRGMYQGWDIRYDVISILAPKNQPMQIEYFEDAFRVEGELG